MADKDPTLANSVLGAISQAPPNPYGADPKDLDAYAKAQEAAVDALQHRYDKPNWFNIAGAFGKPQLGGFFASLGNVSQVMGDQLERQRDAAVQANMLNKELMNTRILQGQNRKQSQILGEWQAKGYTPSPNELASFIGLNPLSATAVAAKGLYQDTLNAQAIQANQAKNYRDFPETLNSDLQANFGKDDSSASYKQYATSIDASRPPQISPTTWSSMLMDDKAKAVADYGRMQKEAGMSQDEKLRQQSEQAPDRLETLLTIRDLAVGKGLPDFTPKDKEGNPLKDKDGNVIKKTGQQQMAEALGYLQGGSLIDAIGKAANEGKYSNFMSGFATYASRIGLSPQANDRMQELAKHLYKQALEMRNYSSNPTDAYTMLQNMASPNIDNSQTALVTLIDLMAHNEKISQEKYRFLQNARATGKKLPYGQLENDDTYLKMLQQNAKEHADIATRNPLMGVPEFYSPSYTSLKSLTADNSASGSAPSTKAGQSSGKTTASRTPPAGWIKNADGTFSKVKP